MGKTVLITGASRGIGRACALAFGKAGWNVAVHYGQSGQAARALVRELQDLGCDADLFRADVRDPAQVRACAAAAAGRFCRIDALVCCAGVAQQKLLCDITDGDWDSMLGTDLSGVFYFDRAVLPGMLRAQKGAIVHVSSVWGVHGASCETHYSAAKAGVIGLTRALAKEVGPSGVRVNCVAPGVIGTDMCACFDESTIAALAEETPLGRIGRPEDVANAVLFLCSEEAAFITGQTLGVDGGFAL